MTQTKPENQIDYVEMPVSDMAAAKQFYGGVFGWKLEDYGPAYTSFFDGHMAGGFTTGTPGPAQALLLVIYAGDLAAMEAKIRAAGGVIVRETYSFPGGQRFHFADPSGNELAVWSDAG